ncbi:MAG: carboxymuconolactone decarboxylase [Gammaproteobacteria bacterium]|nr:MAG: carboxymuconolactone decarboxylase [Gammaproteobacteria bacterium]
MSRALDYLIKTRPEAMEHYFQFLKRAGEHLDPKTRALISVITKVHAQTGPGFRQYLKRALDTGASADEVIDALMMAFPALGLTRIVWAIDQILEMDLPEFRLPERESGKEEEWHEVATLQELPKEKGSVIEAGGRTLLLWRDEEGVKAWDNHCPHQGTPLRAEDVKGGWVCCPLHFWTFDLATGRCVEPPGGSSLQALPVRVREGRVEVRW